MKSLGLIPRIVMVGNRPINPTISNPEMAFAILLQPKRRPKTCKAPPYRDTPIRPPTRRKIHDKAMAPFARAIKYRPDSATPLLDDVHVATNFGWYRTHRRNRMYAA